MIALWLLAAEPAHAARGMMGLEWRPFSRQDLVWVDQDRVSGTAVGEQDGTVRPNLSMFGGAWIDKHVGVVGSLGLAAIVSRTQVEEGVAARSWAVIRPALDVRLGWMEPRLRVPIPWVVVGAFGDIPTVSDKNPSYTAEEQAAADDTARDDGWRLGGIGGRVGMGVDLRLVEGLALGAQATVGLVGSSYLGGDQGFTTLSVATEASLLLTWVWPDRRRVRGEAPIAPEPASPPPSAPSETPSAGG